MERILDELAGKEGDGEELIVQILRLLIILAIIPLASSAAFAQSKHVPVFVSNGVFVRDSTIAQVLDVWEHYLNSRPDSNYDNPYWNEAEKRRYHPFDLSSDVFFPNLYLMIGNYKPSVLSISEEKPYYKIRTLYASIADSNFADPVEIQEVFAKQENGVFKLYNALPIKTKSWKHETIGSITYIFPPYHQFNRNLAMKMSDFSDSIAHVAGSKPIPVDFYFANSLDELMKARGLDFRMGEGNASSSDGMAWPGNRFIFGSGTNEWYPHELVHVYFNPMYPKANYYFSEGIATMLGGTRGMSLRQLIRHADMLLVIHPDIRFDSILDGSEDVNIDYRTGVWYLVGGMLMQMAYDKGGWPLCKRLLTYGEGPSELLKAVDEVFGVQAKDYDRFIKQKIREYAEK